MSLIGIPRWCTPKPTPQLPLVRSRLQCNDRDNWTGPDYALDALDELVMDNAQVHFEMSSDTSAYMIVEQPGRQVFVQFSVRELSKTERHAAKQPGRPAPRAVLTATVDYDSAEEPS